MTKEYTIGSGKTIKVTAKNKRVAKRFQGGEDHYAYTIVFQVVGNDVAFKTPYHDSVYNFSRGRGYSEELIDSAVYCILMDAYSYEECRDVETFCRTFDYEDVNQGRKVYNACRDTYEIIHALLTEEEIEELYNIVEQ